MIEEKDPKVIVPCHAVGKKASDKLRFIFDGTLSNSFFPKLRTYLPSPFSILKRKFKWACSIDLSAAFFHFRMHPEFAKYFCVRGPISKKVFSFQKNPFGAHHSMPCVTAALIQLTEAICNKVHEELGLEDWAYTVIYVDDDHIATNIDDPEMLEKFVAKFVEIWEELGFVINHSKS